MDLLIAAAKSASATLDRHYAKVWIGIDLARVASATTPAAKRMHIDQFMHDVECVMRDCVVLPC